MLIQPGRSRGGATPACTIAAKARRVACCWDVRKVDGLHGQRVLPLPLLRETAVPS